MFALPHFNESWLLRRPPYRTCFAQPVSQLLGEIIGVFFRALFFKRVKETFSRPGRWRADLALHFFVQTLSDNRPIAKILGHRPNQLHGSITDLFNMSGRVYQEIFRRLPRFDRKYD